MQIPARVLREEVRSRDSLFNERTTRERDREERMLKMATSLFARYGMKAISFTSLAMALGMGASTLRRHFVDLESLFGTILRNHITDIANAIGNVPPNVENPRQAARAAYLKATRTGFGAPIEAHLLLIRDRNILPQDELESIQQRHFQLGVIMAGDRAEEALILLDAPIFNGARIEQILALPPLDAIMPEITMPLEPDPPAITLPSPSRRVAKANAHAIRKPAGLSGDAEIDDMTRISGVRYPAGLDANGKMTAGVKNGRCPQGP